MNSIEGLCIVLKGVCSNGHVAGVKYSEPYLGRDVAETDGGV